MNLTEDANFINDCIGWDVSNWSKILSVWQKEIAGKGVLKVLEIGAGPGGLSLWMAAQGHHVTCTDLEDPQKVTEALHNKYDVEGTITYRAMNALDIPFKEEFDIVFFKSVIGGVSRDGADNNAALMQQQIHAALKPGGCLLFSENLKSTFLHQFLRKKFIRWGASWNYQTLKSLRSAMACFQTVEYKTTGFLGTFGRTEAQRRFLSLFDRWLWNRIFPSSWHYIYYGIARKA